MFVSVALVIHHAKCLCLIILSPATCLAVSYFSTVSHKLCGFRKINSTKPWNVCIDFLYNLCLKHFSSWKSAGLCVRCPLFLSDLHYTWISSTDFRKKILKYRTSWKFVRRESSCSMRIDGQADRSEAANSRFSEFCETRLKCFNGDRIIWNFV